MSAAQHTRITASLLLALFLSFSAARGLFFHTHVEGRTLISHSHPFSDNTHHHSTAQLISIDALCSSAMTGDCAQSAQLSPVEWSSTLTSTEIQTAPLSGYSHTLSDRAPPLHVIYTL